MKYQNKRTGAVIDITSELKDKDWEPLSAPDQSLNQKDTASEKKQRPAAKRKK